ncbi:MAG: Flp pilus assembly complex ATPase component TadA [Halobacteriovoraceae bacterium]|jgi:type IV pilus assembly protein PilB|nr:Flp pilus assembly complex ATPase component TadA [Halobacteriovoraceae bacterium]
MGQLTIEYRETNEEKIGKNAPYTSLFRECLKEAQRISASDIHIEPNTDCLVIRIRVNGDLFIYKTLDKEYRQSFIQEVKRLCNISIAISNRPQDSRLSLPSWKLALRVNSTPTLYGEKIVLRLLDMTTDFNLDSVNLSKDVVKDLVESANEKNGVIIVSGATGSGKTRTLFSLLNSLDKEKKNIVSLEDPVEYTFKGINQIEIKDSLTFADGLRAILRQDPDVILVGEIRDYETADLCFKASATGHLVISTLHANNAAKVVERLKNMGVEQFMIDSNLKFSSAQVLIKKLCPFCSFEANLDEVIKISPLSQLVDKNTFKSRNNKGCSKCKNGIIGRVPVMEYLTKTELANIHQLKPKKSLLDEYIEKACSGLIDFKEVANFE